MASPQNDQQEQEQEQDLDETREHRKAVTHHLRIELFNYTILPLLFLGALAYSLIALPWASNWLVATYIGVIILGSAVVLVKLSNPYTEFWKVYIRAIRDSQLSIEGGKQG